MEETTQTTYPSIVRRITLGIVAVIFAGIGALIAFGLFQLQNNAGNGPSTGDLEPAPDFTVPLYSGGAGDFTLSDHLGSPVVVNFWGSWCPPCRAEFPALQAVADEYKDRGSHSLRRRCPGHGGKRQSLPGGARHHLPHRPRPHRPDLSGLPGALHAHHLLRYQGRQDPPVVGRPDRRGSTEHLH